MDNYVTICENNENFKFKLSEDYEGYFSSFINENVYNNKLIKSFLKLLAEQRAIGFEYYLCTYNENDFGYEPGMVTLIFWKPIDEEDTIIYFKNNLFYDYLLKFCEETVKSYPENTNDVYKYLEIIKNDLLKK